MATSCSYRALDFKELPKPLLNFSKEYREDELDGSNSPKCKNSNFLKGVKWSPDGSCISSASEDKVLRVLGIPSDVLGISHGLEEVDVNCTPSAWLADSERVLDHPDAVVRIQEGELIYDYTWYPYMTSSNPQTCCILATCRANPIHLWDTCTGSLRATYRAYNYADEITAALCVSFANDGSQILAGYNKAIRIFDTAVPGRRCDFFPTHSKKQHGQPGMISCISPSPVQSKVFAAGSYLGTVAMYSQEDGEMICLLEGHSGGLTQVLFSRDGNFLYSGARKDPEIVCWDIRATRSPVYTITRATSTTNQRIQFDIEPCGRHLISGGEDGFCQVFDLTTGTLVQKFEAAKDTVNAAVLHPWAALLATGSGHRRLEETCIPSSPPEEMWSMRSQLDTDENSLRIWSLDSHWMQYGEAARGLHK